MRVRDAILRERYMLPHETCAADVWDRVARHWSDNDAQREQFFDMMNEGRALPNTPAIANAGKAVACGSACFVLPVEDSLTKGESSIAETLKDSTAVHQYGGGTGFSFGRLREKGARVSTTGRAAPGPVSFIQGYSDWFKRVSQSGLRNAANMAIMPVDHPDIMEFISCKEAEGSLTNFNISVALTDEFMHYVSNRTGYQRDVVSKLLPGGAGGVWDAIIDGAWRNGEPGAFFIDSTNNTRLHPELVEATNPCGEVPLLPYEACVLGSVNLAAHHAPGLGVEWAALGRTVRQLVRMLDNIVEKQDYPLDKIRKQHHLYRKIGVGVMGYADALILMGVRYGSHDAQEWAKAWMRFIQEISYDESHRIADEKGAYRAYRKLYGDKRHPPHEEHFPYRRNLCCQVIAPTGSISRLAECSFGIEPVFATSYTSHIVGQDFHEVHPLADRSAFITSGKVAPLDHVATQAAFQRYTDQAVSKTVNLPYEATREDVAAIYLTAWQSGCKGITVYRTGSREDVVIEPDGCRDGKCSL